MKIRQQILIGLTLKRQGLWWRMYIFLQLVLFLMGNKFTHLSLRIQGFLLQRSVWFPFCLKSASAGIDSSSNPWVLHCCSGEPPEHSPNLKSQGSVAITPSEIRAGAGKHQCFSGLQPLFSKILWDFLYLLRLIFPNLKLASQSAPYLSLLLMF